MGLMEPFMSDWCIRPAVTTDAPTLVGIIHAAFEEYRGQLDPPSGAHSETVDTISRKLESSRAALALTGEMAVGCVFFEESPGRMYLSRLAVLPERRRRGLGQKLIEFVEEQARAQQLGRIYLGVRLVLHAQRAYYERLGYRLVGEAAHPGYASPTYVIMEKCLLAEY
jgi:ribosomal protein S18 acetylase RimI-like enzyme